MVLVLSPARDLHTPLQGGHLGELVLHTDQSMLCAEAIPGIDKVPPVRPRHCGGGGGEAGAGREGGVCTEVDYHSAQWGGEAGHTSLS